MGGRIAVVGAVGNGGAPAQLAPPALIGTSARMQGLSVGSREMYEAMLRAITLHQIRPVIDRIVPWTDAARALDEMLAGNHFGKIVLAFE